jgi:hypothetical protein
MISTLRGLQRVNAWRRGTISPLAYEPGPPMAGTSMLHAIRTPSSASLVLGGA